jgi:hypothetical protein
LLVLGVERKLHVGVIVEPLVVVILMTFVQDWPFAVELLLLKIRALPL